MDSNSIIAPPVRMAQEPLADIYPDETDFFKNRFIWTGQTKGFYTRRAYEPDRDKVGKPFPKWRPFKTRGTWQALFTQLADAFVEKHLNFPGVYRRLDDWLRTQDDETAFWLGTMAGRKTYHHCIDLDSHDVIGWNLVPTRWHPEFNEFGGFGPWEYRYVPFVRPSLRFFQMAKIVHDHFPNRIWSFSSANLGLAIWKMYRRPELTAVVHRRFKNRLAAVGLADVEQYPLPPSKADSLGRCHRRPCGMDTGIITSKVVVTHPIEQIQVFMSPPTTPSFGEILKAWFSQMDMMCDRFLSAGGSVAHEPLSVVQREKLVDDCNQVAETVWRWYEDGCPIDDRLFEVDGTVEPDENAPDNADAELPNDVITEDEIPLIIARQKDTISCDCRADVPSFFKTADLKAVAGSGQWVQFVKFVVENGLPCENKLSKAISALALWFCFVELYGEDQDRIKHVLRTFVLRKHNNMVSRLLAAQQSDVLAQVGRIVDDVLDKEDDAGKRLFSELRQKRSSGRYKVMYFFEPQILEKQESSLLLQSQQQQSSYLECRGLIQDATATSEWEYVPDNTPLPEETIDRIRAAFKEANRQLRRNRKTGRYHTLDAITRLFNYLFCGRKPGTRRASGELLARMGFPKKTVERKQLIRVIVGGRLLHEGAYRHGKRRQSKQWILDASIIREMCCERKEKRVAS